VPPNANVTAVAADAGALWRSPYEMAAPTLAHGPAFDMETTLETLWTQMQPLYTQLHAYVRKQLARRFSTVEEPLLMKDTAIPAELLGESSRLAHVGSSPPQAR